MPHFYIRYIKERKRITKIYLFASLVDLAQEHLKHLLLEALALVNLVDQLHELAGTLLLECLVSLLQLHVVVKLLDDLLLGIVLLAVVLLEDLALLGGGKLQGLVDQPGALVVLDVGADLANVLGQAKVVEVVVLDLEVLAEGDEDVLCGLQVLGGGNVQHVERQGDGEVEGVVGGLVDDDEAVLFHGEVVEVDDVLGRGEQVAELAELGLERALVEELDELDVAGVVAEVLLEDDVDAGLEQERVVDGDHADALLAVPTGLAAARDAAVHDVVGDEEEGLEELRHPAQRGSLEVFLLSQRSAQDDGDRVGDRHAPVAFPAEGVGLEVLKVGKQNKSANCIGMEHMIERESSHTFLSQASSAAGSL